MPLSENVDALSKVTSSSTFLISSASFTRLVSLDLAICAEVEGEFPDVGSNGLLVSGELEESVLILFVVADAIFPFDDGGSCDVVDLELVVVGVEAVVISADVVDAVNAVMGVAGVVVVDVVPFVGDFVVEGGLAVDFVVGVGLVDDSVVEGGIVDDFVDVGVDGVVDNVVDFVALVVAVVIVVGAIVVVLWCALSSKEK